MHTTLLEDIPHYGHYNTALQVWFIFFAEEWEIHPCPSEGTERYMRSATSSFLPLCWNREAASWTPINWWGAGSKQCYRGHRLCRAGHRIPIRLKSLHSVASKSNVLHIVWELHSGLLWHWANVHHCFIFLTSNHFKTLLFFFSHTHIHQQSMLLLSHSNPHLPTVLCTLPYSQMSQGH